MSQRPFPALSAAAVLAAVCLLSPVGLAQLPRLVNCGDLNGDTRISIVDALRAAQLGIDLHDCASVIGFELCDLSPATPDGVCGIGDALRIAQCEVGLIPCGFTCRPLLCG